MKNESINPNPWRQVGAAILPALLLIMAPLFERESSMLAPLIAVVIGLLLLALVMVIRRRSLSDFPVWGMVPFSFALLWLSGIPEVYIPGQAMFPLLISLVGLGALGLTVVKRREFTRRQLVVWVVGAVGIGLILIQWSFFRGFRFWRSDAVILLLPMVAGLLLARKHGVAAGLIVLPIGAFVMSFHVEHVIYFREARVWGQLISLALPVLFFVIAPIWILRSRSALGQSAGVLIPIVFYGVLLLLALSLVSVVSLSNGYDLMKAVTIAEPVIQLFITMALVCVLFGWVRGQHMTSVHADGHSIPA